MKTTGRRADTDPTGTRASGFAKGAIWGPFKCGSCRHMEQARGTCAHPEVIGDKAPELAKRDDRNHPYVDAEDCCTYERKATPGAGAAERSGMRG